MKIIFYLVLFIFMIPMNIYGQVYVSTDYREYCSYNSYLEKFTSCDGYDENTLFKINSNETMFEHITPSINSSYYINSKEYGDEEVTYEVKSDVGNTYIYTFDFGSEEVRILARESDGSFYMIRFYIKKYWSD